jgi:hypothetical protein
VRIRHLHTHSHTHSHTHTHAYPLSHSFSLSLTYTHTHTHTHTHSHTHTHTHTRTYTYTHTLFLTHSHTHMHTYTHSHTHSHRPWRAPMHRGESAAAIWRLLLLCMPRLIEHTRTHMCSAHTHTQPHDAGRVVSQRRCTRTHSYTQIHYTHTHIHNCTT